MRRMLCITVGGLVCVLGLALPADAQYRSLDGTGNNAANPTWGAANTAMLRLMPNAYGDGISTPAGGTLAGARLISNLVCDEDSQVLSKHVVSNTVMQWGQWITHDLGFKRTQEPAEPFPIPVPKFDSPFDPEGTGTVTLPFFRSKFDPATGTDKDNPRQQISFVSSFIDCNTVYGSNQQRADFLRTFQDGKLLTSSYPEGPLPPWNTVLEPMDTSPFGSSKLEGMLLCGDDRANTQLLLLCMHTLFVREHNRQCDVLKAANPRWNDEKLYQEARRRVIALNEAITFNEFLPAILGPGVVPAYTGYKPAVNPTVSNEFSHAAFRFGHSQLNQVMLRLAEDGSKIGEGTLRMRDQFFLPELLVTDEGIDPLLRGMVFQPLQEVDRKMKDDVRSFLYGDPNAKGFDLAADDIQRARDHGLPLYNAARVAAGLSKLTGFSQVSSDPDTASRLAQAYATVDDIDFFIGGICEDHVPGGTMGPLFTKLIGDDFVRVRDGDRFWYQNNQFSRQELDEINATTLADVIKRNTTIVYLQPNVFIAWPDVNRDHQLDIDDFIEFQILFAFGDPLADFDKDGTLGIDDFIEFQTAWYVFQ